MTPNENYQNDQMTITYEQTGQSTNTDAQGMREMQALVRAIGGRLKTDYRYSAGLCYNPFPKLTAAQKEAIEDAAWEVLGTREAHHGKTLAELYDPDTIPADLREAHHQLDLLVDRCYRDQPFRDENERLELLLKMYDKMKGKN